MPPGIGYGENLQNAIQKILGDFSTARQTLEPMLPAEGERFGFGREIAAGFGPDRSAELMALSNLFSDLQGFSSSLVSSNPNFTRRIGPLGAPVSVGGAFGAGSSSGASTAPVTRGDGSGGMGGPLGGPLRVPQQPYGGFDGKQPVDPFSGVVYFGEPSGGTGGTGAPGTIPVPSPTDGGRYGGIMAGSGVPTSGSRGGFLGGWNQGGAGGNVRFRGGGDRGRGLLGSILRRMF
jgi:hypothetical protein